MRILLLSVKYACSLKSIAFINNVVENIISCGISSVNCDMVWRVCESLKKSVMKT